MQPQSAAGSGSVGPKVAFQAGAQAGFRLVQRVRPRPRVKARFCGSLRCFLAAAGPSGPNSAVRANPERFPVRA